MEPLEVRPVSPVNVPLAVMFPELAIVNLEVPDAEAVKISPELS